MANTGLKNEAFISELLDRGSLAVDTKNEEGIYTFTSASADDGVVFGKLIKPKYNEDELVRSIDTIIDELIPLDIPEGPETVLKVIYDAALAEIALRDETIKAQSAVILDLRAKVSELEIVSQSLRVEIDAKELALAVSQNQTQTSNNKVSSLTIDLSNAIQKATAESIQRVSLFARNQSLQQEVDSLRDQLFGKQNELAEGAKASENISVLVVNKGDSAVPGLLFEARANKATERWVNGPVLEITNFTDTESVTITFQREGQAANMIDNISQITLGPKEKKSITVKANLGWIRDKKPKGGFGFATDTGYEGSIKITSNKGDLISQPMKLHKYRGTRYTGN